MRITGGDLRSRLLKSPDSRAVRPTTDLVRGAIFSLLGQSGGTRVLDLYAGTGALGIEALSRGAEWADFVDQRPQSCAIIKANLRALDLEDCSHVYTASVASALGYLAESYDLVFLDPPYAQARETGAALELLAGSAILAAEARVVVCHPSREPLGEYYGTLAQIKDRRYGDTAVTIYRKETPA
jgi:16S rRNA (guanine966-N2)-methyltransferase